MCIQLRSVIEDLGGERGEVEDAKEMEAEENAQESGKKEVKEEEQEEEVENFLNQKRKRK